MLDAAHAARAAAKAKERERRANLALGFPRLHDRSLGARLSKHARGLRAKRNRRAAEGGNGRRGAKEEG